MPQLREEEKGAVLWGLLCGSPQTWLLGGTNRGRRDGKSQPPDDREWAGGGEGSAEVRKEEGGLFVVLKEGLGMTKPCFLAEHQALWIN